VGAVVAAPEAALPLAVVAHAVLDLVPHWDYTRTRRPVSWAYLDVGGSALFALALVAAGAPWVVPVCALLAALPDVDSVGLVIPSLGRRQWFPSHWRRFPHGDCSVACGLALQAIVIAVSLGALLAGLA
jgi:hypothetical protein